MFDKYLTLRCNETEVSVHVLRPPVPKSMGLLWGSVVFFLVPYNKLAFCLQALGNPIIARGENQIGH